MKAFLKIVVAALAIVTYWGGHIYANTPHALSQHRPPEAIVPTVQEPADSESSMLVAESESSMLVAESESKKVMAEQDSSAKPSCSKAQLLQKGGSHDRVDTAIQRAHQGGLHGCIGSKRSVVGLQFTHTGNFRCKLIDCKYTAGSNKSRDSKIGKSNGRDIPSDILPIPGIKWDNDSLCEKILDVRVESVVQDLIHSRLVRKEVSHD